MKSHEEQRDLCVVKILITSFLRKPGTLYMLFIDSVLTAKVTQRRVTLFAIINDGMRKTESEVFLASFSTLKWHYPKVGEKKL